MRGFVNSMIGAGLVVGSASCVTPTDSSGALEVRVAPIGELLRGDSTRVVATLVNLTGGEIANASFVFSSSDPTIVLVSADGALLAANSGSATVTVRAASVAGSRPAQVDVRVIAEVGIDSVRPVTVRYGENLQVYGRGLAPGGGASVVSIEGVNLPIMGYVPTDADNPARQGVLSVRIAPPLRTQPDRLVPANVTVTSPRGIISADLPLQVLERDLFEPNQLAPASLGLLTAKREWIGLAYEPADSVAPADWYTFTTAAPGDWVVKLKWGPTTSGLAGLVAIPNATPEVFAAASFFGAASPVFLTNGASTTGAIAFCRGQSVYRDDLFGGPKFPSGIGVGAAVTGPVETSISLRGLPAGTHHLLVAGDLGVTKSGDYGYPGADRFGIIVGSPFEFFLPARYDLTIEPSSASVLAPDANEPNNVCDAAPSFLTLGATPIVDSLVTLTFDTDWDNDWLRAVATQPGTLEIDFSFPGPQRFMVADLISDATAPDSLLIFGGFRTAGPAWTPPGGDWDGSLTTCIPNPAIGLNFICGPGNGMTSEIQLYAGNYLLHLGPQGPPGPYTMRIRWTP